MSQDSNAFSLSGCNPKPQKIPSTQFQPRDNRIQIGGVRRNRQFFRQVLKASTGAG